MFTFINTSRVGTAVQGVAAAEKGFQHALWYCKERRSMRALSGKKEPEEVADAIIWQPAVRQMLLTQKAVAEGGRSMVYECAAQSCAILCAILSGAPRTRLHTSQVRAPRRQDERREGGGRREGREAH